MILSTLHESLNVIDWRGMVHLMPSDYETALASAKFSGAMLGAACAFGLCLCVSIVATILTDNRQQRRRTY